MPHPQTCPEGQLRVMGKVTALLRDAKVRGMGNGVSGDRLPPLHLPSLCFTLFDLLIFNSFPPSLLSSPFPLSPILLPSFHFPCSNLLASFPRHYHFLFSLLSILLGLSFHLSVHFCLHFCVYKSDGLSISPFPSSRPCPCLPSLGQPAFCCAVSVTVPHCHLLFSCLSFSCPLSLTHAPELEADPRPPDPDSDGPLAAPPAFFPKPSSTLCPPPTGAPSLLFPFISFPSVVPQGIPLPGHPHLSLHPDSGTRNPLQKS